MRSFTVWSSIALLLGAVSVSSPATARPGSVTCEAKGGHTRSCPMDTSDGVELVTQLSHSACIEGDTWDYDERRVWVSNGCRARFRAAGSGDYSRDYDADTDSSYHADRGDSNAAGAIAALALTAIAAAAIQHHNKKERRNNDDHYEHEYDQDYYGQHSRPSDSVRCESGGGHYQYCRYPVRGNEIEIQRQLSHKQCRFGDSWGYDRSGIWVDRGCRAEFAIYR